MPVGSTPFVVTAFAVLNGLGDGTAAVRRSLRAGMTGLRSPTIDVPFDTVVGEVRDALPVLPARLAAYESRIARMALALYDEVEPAVTKARARLGSDRIALILGSSTGGLERTEAFLRAAHEGSSLEVAYDLDRQHAFHAVVDIVAELSGLRGPRYTISSACTSSAKVFAAAKRLVSTGVVDAALVGGIDGVCATTLHGFHSLGVLSKTACRPFGAGRDGMNVGEGGALVLLERGGEGDVALLGVGESSDAHHMSAPHPEGLGAEAAMRAALADAEIAAEEIDHVNAHGTGTLQNDAAEALAIARVLGTNVPVVSTKGYTGHLLGAAGATEAVFSILSLTDGFVPASLGAETRDPALTIDVATSLRAQRITRVASNSLAFGGNNASLVFGRIT